MNLYIIEGVLNEYTSGMVVIAAPTLERCQELFLEEWPDPDHRDELQRAINRGYYDVLEVMNREEGIVNYCYGG